MEIQTTLIDFQRVYKTIEGLSDLEKDKVIRQGLRTATNIFLKVGLQRLRERMKQPQGVTGNLVKAFQNKLKRNKLGALAGFNYSGHHAHLVDLGTAKRTNKKGQNRGVMPPLNFWKDTIQGEQSTAINAVYQGIERGITKLLMRN